MRGISFKDIKDQFFHVGGIGAVIGEGPHTNTHPDLNGIFGKDDV